MRAYSLKLLADYSFPMEKRLSGTYPKRDDQTQFNKCMRGNMLVRGAAWTLARTALLMRVVVCTTWVGIGLSLLIWFLSDSAMEKWCGKSSFRKNPRQGDDRYEDEAAELKAFYQAFQETF
jgi:hypothetical protein